MEAVAATEKKKPARKIPEALIYEVMDGKPYYRKGYKAVLNRNKTLEDIMGSSTLQSAIIFYLQKLLFQFFEEDSYWVFSNESGLHVAKGENLAGDIFVYDVKTLPPQDINTQYAQVPPQLAFEIDIKADLEKESDIRYIHRKTSKLLDFGVQRVFWILTEARKVLVAEKDNPTIEMIDWNQDIEIQPALRFNIGAYLEQRGIVLED